MPGFGRAVPGDAVVEGVGSDRMEDGRRSSDDVAVENHRDRAPSSGEDRRRNRHQFESADLGESRQRIEAVDARDGGSDGRDLSGQTVVVDAGSPTDPVLGLAAAHGVSHSSRGSGVPDSHLSEDEEIGLGRVDDATCRFDAFVEPVIVDGAFGSEIAARTTHSHIDDFEFGTGDSGQRSDRGSVGGECVEHRLGDLDGILAHPAVGDPVVGGEDDSERSIDSGSRASLPTGNPDREIVETSECPGGPQNVVGSTAHSGP